ncbi:uncharacterized protein LOC130420431 [Triplophysa dalaica]|uniref:uncharacterized protein LOC130420431 n=1 Tax=Triplophysa dalaica TaxID=1582913 RepID=UPI0024DFDE3C|nr:uncharacterized protein LOC130420431 [Triplophysa dalaica]
MTPLMANDSDMCLTLPLSADDESFFALQSELEVLEKQIHDLLERQTRLRERKTAMETSRADARKAASPGFKITTSRNELHSCTCTHTAEGEIQDRSDDLSPTATTATKKKSERKKTGGDPVPPPYTPAEELALGLNSNRPIVEGIPGGSSSLDPKPGTSSSHTFITVLDNTPTLLPVPKQVVAQAYADSEETISDCLWRKNL